MIAQHTLPKEISPGLYQCGCDYVAHLSEKALGEAREQSYRKKLWLSEDAERERHILVLQDGQIVGMLCPRKVTMPRRTGLLGRCLKTAAVIVGVITVLSMFMS